MITLLPYSTRFKLKLAKRNSILMQYIFVLATVGAFVAVYYVGMTIQIQNIEKSNEQQITTAAQKDQGRINQEQSAQAEATSIQTALSSAKTSLTHPSYFKLLTAFSSSLPKGVIVKKLDFSSQTMKEPVKIQLFATTTSAISGTKAGLEQHKDIFTKIAIESINTDSTDAVDPKYPVTAVLNLTIDQGALK